MEKDHPLMTLNGRRVGHYRIRIELKPLRSRQGWTHFFFYLEDQRGRISSQKHSNGQWTPTHVLEGIHSRGGRGVTGWIEVGDYFPIIYFQGLGNPSETLLLSEDKRDHQIFNLLSEIIQPGGHLMFVYEVSYESSFHQETQESLLRGIPPVSTAQGTLLFYSGFRWVKDWYLAEGGHEGLRKLWGEKPFSEAELQRFDLLTFFQLLAFLSRKLNSEFLDLDSKARERTLGVLSELKLASTLLVFREKTIKVYQDCFNQGVLEEAPRQICQLVEAFKTFHFEDDLIREELERISKECMRVFL